MIEESPIGIIRIRKQGAPSVLEYTTDHIGKPAYQQVLLRQEAIGLNFVDILFRNGTFPLSKFPATIGVEAAGIIESIGDGVKDLAVGDRVGYYFNLGAYSTHRLMDENQLIKIPHDVSLDQAASLLAKGLTARMLVKQAYPVKEGDFILVHAAAGGVGSLVSKWAKALGATVIGTVGSIKKKTYALSLGIDYVVALDTENLSSVVNSITQNKGVNAVFDGVGKATFNQSIPLVATGGSVVLFGSSSGAPAIDFHYLESKQITLTKADLGRFLPDRESIERAANDVFEALRSGILGDIRPTIYELSDVERAHQDLENAKTTGSVIFHIKTNLKP